MRDRCASAAAAHILLQAARYTNTEQPPGEHAHGFPGSNRRTGAIREERSVSSFASWFALPSDSVLHTETSPGAIQGFWIGLHTPHPAIEQTSQDLPDL